MNWNQLSKQAGPIKPVSPTDGTNFSNWFNSNVGNGWGTGTKKKKPKPEEKPKEKGKGEQIDVKAAVDGLVKVAGLAETINTLKQQIARNYEQMKNVKIMNDPQTRVRLTRQTELLKEQLERLMASQQRITNKFAPLQVNRQAEKIKDVDIDDLWTNGHGRTIGSCGHTISSCRCKHASDKKLERRVHELCHECKKKKL